MANSSKIILKARINGIEQKIPITVSTDSVYLVGEDNVTLTQKLADIIQELDDKISTKDLDNLKISIPIAGTDTIGGIVSVESEDVDGVNTYYIYVEPDTGKARVSIPKGNVTAEDILNALSSSDIILNGGTSR